MTTSSNSEQNSSPDLEDIFAESDTGQPPQLPESAAPALGSFQSNAMGVEPSTAEPEVAEVAAETAYQPPVTRPSRRRWLIVAIVIGILLLLGGSIGVVFYLLQRSAVVGNDSATNNLNLNTITNTVTPPINVPLNTNVPPVNADTTNTAGTFIDVDHDGLSDQEELIANTNPKKKDTDEDGLSDREEVRVYLTDPRNPDTDGDSYTDGVEVANFYHPNDPDPKKRLFDLPQ